MQELRVVVRERITTTHDPTTTTRTAKAAHPSNREIEGVAREVAADVVDEAAAMMVSRDNNTPITMAADTRTNTSQLLRGFLLDSINRCQRQCLHTRLCLSTCSNLCQLLHSSSNK